MKIISLKRYPARKQPAVEESVLTLIQGCGIESDCHADGGERQISVLTLRDRQWMDAQPVKGFCFSKFKENILIDMCGSEILPGMCLRMGEAVIRITETGKACHPELCSLARSGEPCEMAGGSLFAEVISGGTIRCGASIEIEV